MNIETKPIEYEFVLKVNRDELFLLNLGLKMLVISENETDDMEIWDNMKKEFKEKLMETKQ